MGKLLLLGIGLVLIQLLSTAQERYQQVRVALSPVQNRASIARLGIDVEYGIGKPGAWVDLFVSVEEADLLREAGFSFTVLIKDWAEEYAHRLMADRAMPAFSSETGTAAHFRLGSMGGFLTPEELRVDLDSMRVAYGSLVSGPDSIGRSWEGRPIWSMKISARVTSDEAEPRALYTALTHAREGGGMMVLVNFMWYLLEHYGVDPEVTALLETRELFFVPAVNPDGYAHNAATSPGGGGMWRKNRRLNSDGTIGVDLNRNFGYYWGYDDIGSSPSGSSNTYRGGSAFSEPELQALRSLCIDREFAMALNYHSYGNLLIYPWGYLDTDTGDSLLYRSLATRLTRFNGYTYGTGGETVGYVTNGDADDWMYGDTNVKPRMISFTPEIGTDEDGFWPVPSRIPSQVQENLEANLILAHAAGPYVSVGSPLRIQGTIDTAVFQLPLRDAGMSPVQGPIQVSLSSEHLEFRNSQLIIPQIADPLFVHATLRGGALPGQPVQLVVRLSYAGGSTQDTLMLRAGEPRVVFEETAEQGLARWTVGSNGAGSYWGATDERAANGRFSVTDSPGNPYANNTVTTLTMIEPVALSATGAELRFFARWDIETNYDVARVEVSTGGAAWMTLAGRYTATGSGSGRQAISLPGYDGIRHDWVEEVVALDAYLGKDIALRFVLESDESVAREGIFLDDIKILTYDAPLTTAPAAIPPPVFSLKQNYPNPFNPSTTIGFTLPSASPVRLVVYDLLGRELTTVVEGTREAGSYEVVFDASVFPSGVYFYRMTAGGYSAMRRLVVLR